MSTGDNQLIGAQVLGHTGELLGTVSALLVDPKSLQGRWLQIELAGHPALLHAVLPLAAASLNPAGALATPWTADLVAGAPPVGDQISAEQTRALNEHYGLNI